MTSKFWLVAQREYLTRVRKKSFLVLTLLVPLLVAGFGFFIAKIATSDNEGIDVVRVLDTSPQHLGDRLKATSRLAFVPVTGPLETAKKAYRRTDDAGLLYLPPTLTAQQTTGIQLFAKGNVSLRKQSGVEEALNKVLSEEKLRDAGISSEKLKTLRSSVDIASINLDAEGKEKSSNALATSGISYVLALLIYMFIFIYGVQIMRGVGEEKSSRIMEVMLSSVKPFQLMMGKIMGIAAVGLTQFLLWGVLSWGATAIVGATVLSQAQTTNPAVAAAIRPVANDDEAATPTAVSANGSPATVAKTGKPSRFDGMFEVLGDLPIATIAIGFVLYFLGGYLLYGALFGAIGAAVDDQTDTQQFMFPITMPLILSYIIGVSVILQHPDGPVAFWMSMIPFTSPIAMVIRLPFGVPMWQLALSLGLLVLGFIGTVWVAARIYRVGVLMYGKKITYGELSKWMFYKG